LFSASLASKPLPGETIAMDGKVLRGSYEAISDDETVNSPSCNHAGQCISSKRGLIMDSHSSLQTNEIKAPAFIEQLEEGELSFPLMPLAPKKKNNSNYRRQ
jgi:hypothetical protein